jgi:hypothetical protein
MRHLAVLLLAGCTGSSIVGGMGLSDGSGSGAATGNGDGSESGQSGGTCVDPANPNAVEAWGAVVAALGPRVDAIRLQGTGAMSELALAFAAVTPSDYAAAVPMYAAGSIDLERGTPQCIGTLGPSLQSAILCDPMGAALPGDCTIASLCACVGDMFTVGDAACEGTCFGDCLLDAGGSCDGLCRGACDGDCVGEDEDGVCIGACSGMCTGGCLNSDGACEGTCSGACTIASSDAGWCLDDCVGPIGECSGATELAGVDPTCAAIAAFAGLSAVACTPSPTIVTFDLDGGAPVEFKEAVIDARPALATLVAVVQHIDELQSRPRLTQCNDAEDPIGDLLAGLDQTRTDAMAALTIFGG